MPAISPTLNLLSASANYNAGDWGTFGAQGALDIRPSAALNRGIDLGITAEALIQLDASVRKFIAIDASAFATASAGVRAQLQTPIDLFSEAGLALRLQAQAQAAVGVQLAIGLAVGDFLAVVDSDPRLNGAPARLIRVLLEETTVGGGAMAKAAVAAMAYVNVSATGRLIPQGTQRPGFTVAVEKGAGWGVGAGIKGFVNFGVTDPRNLIRRSVDIAVESTLDDLGALLNDASVNTLLAELRTPLKMALRSTFEIGLELAANGGSFAPGAGATLAMRAVQVCLEEGQRLILDRAIRWAVGELRRSLGELPLTRAAWNAASADRRTLASLLQNFPAEPFEATAANRTYWSSVVDLASRVLTALGGQTSPDDPGVESIATIYAATQLLFITVERVSSGSARASVIGLSPVATAPAFSGSVTAPATVIRQHINKVIGKPASTAITQTALVTYLAEGRVLTLVAAASPELESLASIVAGETPGAIGAGFSTILSNIGAFVPDGAGGVDPRASLVAVLRGLRTYADVRINAELIPKLDELLVGKPPELRTYLDEVLLPSLGFCIDAVFERLIDWSNGSLAGQTALREACSAILMKLFSRSLVVTADAVLDRLLGGLSGAYADLASHINDPGGIAQKLMGIAAVGSLSRADLAEILSEHFQVLSAASRPLHPQQRARIRDLLYRLVDTAPSSPDASFVDQLATDLGVRNLEAGKDLALEFGELWASRFVDFMVAWLEHVGAKILEEIKEVIDAIVRAVEEWIADLEALARDLARRVDELIAEIGRLALEVEQRMVAALDSAALLVTRFAATGSARTTLRREIKSTAVNTCLSALAAVPGYGLVPSWATSQVHSALKAAVDLLLNDAILNVVLDAVRGPALAAADFLRDVRDIEPGDDLTEAILDLFLDRIEDAVRSAFGGSGPRLNLHIRFTARATLQTPWGPSSVSFGIDLDLGRVRIPLSGIINSVRAAARSIDAVGRAAEDLASQLSAAIHAELGLTAAQTEHMVVVDAKQDADTELAETHSAALDAVIISPAASTVVDGSVVAEIHLPGVPLSYLGLKPSQAQRVRVWLNREEIPIDSFSRRDLTTSPRSDLVTNALRDRAVLTGPHSPLLGLRRTPHPLADLRTAVTASTVMPPMRLGRGLRLGERAQLEARSTPGIALTMRLTQAMLDPGVNTLVVSVVDGRGRHRIERSTTFVSLPAEIRPKPPKGTPGRVRVPAPVGVSFALDRMPASVRDRLTKIVGSTPAVIAVPSAGARKARASSRISPTWMPPVRQRRDQWKSEKQRVVGTIKAARSPLLELHEAVNSRTLRAVLPPKPARSGARTEVKSGPIKREGPATASTTQTTQVGSRGRGKKSRKESR